MSKKICVVGAGVMGHAIAAEFAMYGHKVKLFDRSAEILSGAMARIKKDLLFMVDNTYIDTAKMEYTIGNIQIAQSLADAARDVDFAIEAVTEIVEIKVEVMKALDKICSPETIFCTNTSSLSLDSIIKDLSDSRKKKCLVTHYFNPANIIPMVEVSCFGHTTEEAFAAVSDLYRSVEKQAIKILKDVPGMVGNRLQQAIYREAVYLIDEGVVSPEDVDNCLIYGPAFRYTAIGMLGSYDMNSLSLTRRVANNIWPHLSNALNTSGSIVDKMEAEGKDGIKSGEGFYKYPLEKAEEIRAEGSRKLLVMLKASRQMNMKA